MVQVHLGPPKEESTVKKILILAAAVAGAIWFAGRRSVAQPDPWARHSDTV